MKYFSIILLILLSQNGSNATNNVKRRNTADSFDINIGAGYGFGSDHTASTLPRSTTKINHSTSYLSKLLEDELNINQDNKGSVQQFPTPSTLEVQESVKKFVTENPHYSTRNNDYQGTPHQVKEIMNLKDIQKVLHNLDSGSEYSKVLQVLKVPAIYEIHLEKRQKGKDPEYKQTEFLKTTSVHVPRINKRPIKQNVKTEDIIHGNAMTGFTDFANIDDWLQESTRPLQSEDNYGAKVTSEKAGKLNFHRRPPNPTWNPRIESEISGSSYIQKKPQKPNKDSLFHSQITETNSKVPLVYSPEYTVPQKETSNADVPINPNAVFESTRNIYNVAPFPFNQPQAMYEVAPPVLGKGPIYKNQQGSNPVVTLYSTLSPVLPYNLKASHSTKFFRNTQRSGSSIKDVSNLNNNDDQSKSDTINIPVKPGLTTLRYRGSDGSSLGRKCRGRADFHDSSNQETRASSKIDNIYFTTDRPERRSFGSVSGEPKYMIPGIFRPRRVDRRSGEPLKYVLYISEKYSDED